jgi:hypothetical protein
MDRLTRWKQAAPAGGIERPSNSAGNGGYRSQCSQLADSSAAKLKRGREKMFCFLYFFHMKHKKPGFFTDFGTGVVSKI